MLISWGGHCLNSLRFLDTHQHKLYEGEISHHPISMAITKTSVSAAWRTELQAVWKSVGWDCTGSKFPLVLTGFVLYMGGFFAHGWCDCFPSVFTASATVSLTFWLATSCLTRPCFSTSVSTWHVVCDSIRFSCLPFCLSVSHSLLHSTLLLSIKAVSLSQLS